MLSLYRPTSCSVSIFVILPSWWLILISTSPLSLPVSTTGSEEGAVFPPVPWGVFAPGRVCLHGGHVALPLRLHHHVHSAPQVRRDNDLNLSCHKFKSQLQNFPSTSGHLGRCLCNRLICRLFFFTLVVLQFVFDSSATDPELTVMWIRCSRLPRKALQPVWLRGSKAQRQMCVCVRSCVCVCVFQ